jgi:ABC-type multidrug transport system permease subunit
MIKFLDYFLFTTNNLESEKKIPKKVLLVLIFLPFLIATLVFSGLFFGFYVAEILEMPNFLIFPLVFSLFGFFISLIMSWIIAKKVST